MAVVKSGGEEFSASMLKFHGLVAYLYGPTAQQVALRNAQGTVVRMVSTSSELFTYLQPTDDVLKLLVNILRNHTSIYKDGGLFTALLASNIIMRTHAEDIPFNVSTNINKYILEQINKTINKYNVNMNIGKLGDIFCIVKPILCAKLLLKESELTHLSILFAKTFASSFSQNNVNDISVLVDSNNEIIQSALYNGCLLRLGNHPDKDISSKLINKKVLIISSSLSLSCEEFIAEAGSKVTVESLDKFKDDVVFNELITFCKKLILHASLIICQKVVHPVIKSMFRDNNILCIDRVGAMIIPKLEKLCGCKQIPTLILDEIESYVGVVNHIEYININGKMYLRITSNSDTTCNTLLLCGKTEREGEIVNICYQASMNILQNLISNTYVLYGGGCFETKLCMELLNNMPSDVPDDIGCSLFLFKKVVCIIVKSLLDVAVNIEVKSSYFEHGIDKTFHHHWINVGSASCCCCGMIKKDQGNFTYMIFEEIINSDYCGDINGDDVKPLDDTPNVLPLSFLSHSKNVYLSNFKTAFQAAEIVLRIGYRIMDS